MMNFNIIQAILAYMASQLTIVAVTARKLVKFGIFAIIILTIIRLSWNFGVNIYRTIVPPKEAPPTLGFNKLPPIVFPDLAIELPELEFIVETASGTLPEFPNQMRVYAMPPLASSFSSYDNMIVKAEAFGFTRNPLQTSGRIYRFNHPRVPATMEADIITGTFSLSFNLAADSSPLSNRSLIPSEAAEVVRDRLNEAQSQPEDLSSEFQHVFLKVEGQNLVRALSLSDAQLVQINLFRKNIIEGSEESPTVEYPVVTADPNKANVWFIVSGASDNEKKIIAGEYRYLPVDRSLFHTYNVKTAEQALQELAEGRGYVANLGLNVDGKIEITEMYLAYYDPNNTAAFMQPVIVLKGRDNFLAYIPAIVDEQIQRQETGN